MEQSDFLYMCEKAISFCTETDVLLKVLSKLYCQFCTIVQLFGLIVPRVCLTSLKDFRIKLCAPRSRSKKSAENESAKNVVWSDSLKNRRKFQLVFRIQYMIITVPSILSRIFLLGIVYIQDPEGTSYFLNLASKKTAVGQKLFNIPLPMTGTFNRKGKDQ